jgi:hypothetical protein
MGFISPSNSINWFSKMNAASINSVWLYSSILFSLSSGTYKEKKQQQIKMGGIFFNLPAL